MIQRSTSAKIAAPLLSLAFLTAVPAQAQIDTGKRFTMEIINTHTKQPMKVGVACSTLNPAQPNVITYGFADQFHRALSNMGNMGDFAAPADKNASANPLFLHMESYHNLAPLFAKILKGWATPADRAAYVANPVGDNPVIGAKWWCEGKSDKLAPTYRLNGNNIELAR
ncbi:MAG: hypothetical protein LRY54_04535 [Alphaproteobacteria bacterium]|nr:hypothetical protein [Alphaproteobacteria bacterium]